MKRSYTIKLILFCFVTIDNIERVFSCTTSSGSSCILPFKYKGKEYSGCAIIDSGSLTPWCPTSTSTNGVFLRGRNTWGNCDLSLCQFDFEGTVIRTSAAPPATQSNVNFPNLNSPNSGGGSFTSGFGNSGFPAGINAAPGSSGINPFSFPFVQSPSKPRCGVSEVQVTTRIVSGQVSAPNQWPWMVAILKANSLKHHCGGALISDQHVLTAAHCVNLYITSEIIVRLGDYDLSTDSETSTEDFEVDKIFEHEKFNFYSYQNDVALLRLKRRINPFSSYHAVCLPPLKKDFTDGIGIALGWGRLYFGGPRSDILRQVSVNIWKDELCANNYAIRNRTVTSNMLCAGNDGKDSCGGDSGGPLNCRREDGKWEICGIVSWGYRCGSDVYPGVYTRVSEYINWISTKMN